MSCWDGVCEIVTVTLVAYLSCHVALSKSNQPYEGEIVKMEFYFSYDQLMFTESILVDAIMCTVSFYLHNSLVRQGLLSLSNTL